MTKRAVRINAFLYDMQVIGGRLVAMDRDLNNPEIFDHLNPKEVKDIHDRVKIMDSTWQEIEDILTRLETTGYLIPGEK